MRRPLVAAVPDPTTRSQKARPEGETVSGQSSFAGLPVARTEEGTIREKKSKKEAWQRPARTKEISRRPENREATKMLGFCGRGLAPGFEVA